MLLFSLDVAVSVELSLACNIHIGDNEGAGAFQMSALYMLFFQFSGEQLVKFESFLA